MIAQITRIAELALANPDRAYQAIHWYDYAGQFCAEVARDNGLPQSVVAGLVAALSPLNSWSGQLKFTPPSVARGAEYVAKGKQPHAVILGPGFFRNKDKAARCLQREAPLSVLGGDKVRSFYANLTGDDYAVTIDRHALAICGWDRSLTTRAYSRIAVAFKFAGENVGLKPAQVQALTWEYWRITKNGGVW